MTPLRTGLGQQDTFFIDKMEELIKTISEFGVLPTVALALVIILMLVRRRNGNKKIDQRLNDIETNHIHEIKDALERIERKLESGFGRIDGNFEKVKEILLRLEYKKNGRRK